MRAVLLEVPESLLAERRRSGADRWDEMWEGVLHMPPQPSRWHQGFGASLLMTLGPIAKAAGLEAYYETALYRTEKDYRVPDLTFARPSPGAKRIESGAELVVEILSPDDESYEKLTFYADMSVHEVLVVDPETRAFELFTLRAKQYVLLSPDEKGIVRSQVLPVAFATVEGPRFRVATQDDSTEI